MTDRCNFRCRYCMPAEIFGPGYAFLPKPEILTHEEMARIATVFCALGVEKLRITGGEPLLRRGLADFISLLDDIPGEQDLAMTTNGVLLGRHAEALQKAGLQRVTISLDALNPEVFARMNGVGASPDKVISGIDTALNARLGVKINCVVQKGVNENEVLPLVEFARERRISLRFIEFMDTGNTNRWKRDQVVPSAELLELIGKKFPLAPVAEMVAGETARRYHHADLSGVEIGFISSVSQPFCRDCNRSRLSADGQIFTCLFAAKGHDIKTMLRDGATDAELTEKIAAIWNIRDDRYSELRAGLDQPVIKPEMSYIGG